MADDRLAREAKVLVGIGRAERRRGCFELTGTTVFEPARNTSAAAQRSLHSRCSAAAWGNPYAFAPSGRATASLIAVSACTFFSL